MPWNTLTKTETVMHENKCQLSPVIMNYNFTTVTKLLKKLNIQDK